MEGAMIDVTLRNVGTMDDGEPSAELDVTYSGTQSIRMEENTVRPLLLMQPGESQGTVLGVLLEISARQKAGEGTPVPVSLVDALNIRTLLLSLAMEVYP
jgi:hypothetical protein